MRPAGALPACWEDALWVDQCTALLPGQARKGRRQHSSPDCGLPAQEGIQHAIHLRGCSLQGGGAPVGRQAQPAGRKLECQAGKQLQVGQREGVGKKGMRQSWIRCGKRMWSIGTAQAQW